jgi:hypothetical protein
MQQMDMKGTYPQGAHPPQAQPYHAPQVMQPQMAGVAGQTAFGMGSIMGLDQCNALIIKQEFHLIEALGWERNNRYSCFQAQAIDDRAQAIVPGPELFYAKEQCECCERQCCGPQRSTQIMLYTGQLAQMAQGGTGAPIATFNKSMHLQGCCFCRPEMQVVGGTGNPLGRIHDPCVLTKVNQNVYDANGAVLYEICGSCCQIGALCACADFHFDILENGQVVGLIDKIFNGCEELCLQVNTFRIRFPPNADVNRKLLLIGAAFLIDFEYFEQKKG